MGIEGEEVGRAFETWLRVSAEKQQGVAFKERACEHYRRDALGAPVEGRTYLSALQRLKGPAAERVARAVEPFFWSDAPRVRVWLCRGCAAALGINEA